MSRPLSLPILVTAVLLGAPPALFGQSVSALQVARSAHGAVATAHPLATAAAVEVLENGGNAADAAVAAAFAISVVEPSMNSLGGRTQILVRRPDGGVLGIDATTQAPARYDPETAPRASYGYETVGVPGAVAGLMRLLEEHGSLERADVMRAAIDYAENGYRLLPGEARRQASAARRVGEFEGGRLHFQEADGTSYDAGELFRQPALANTLRLIEAGGRDAFYEGEIARSMVADLARHGSTVDAASLADYRAEDGWMIRGSYRGHELSAMHLPTGGAVTIEILHILENFDLSAMDDVEWAAVVGQAIRLAMADAGLLSEPDGAERMTSKAHARERAAQIRVPSGDEDLGVQAAATATPGGWSAPAFDGDSGRALLGSGRDGHTTHLTVADGDGMVVALTQTVGPSMGSKVVAPGLGFVYAATLGGYLGDMSPGTRAPSFISPLAVSKDGEPVVVLGAAGGARIVSAVAQVVLRIVDQDRSLPEALALPRVHADFDGEISVETSPDIGWSPEVERTLESLGFSVQEIARSGAFGRVHAVLFDAVTGEWVGAADPDWEGSAGVPSGEGR